jgi:putative hydrolase of the HAD superfamily
MRAHAVIFDLGGVVLDSPLHAIARYEREIGIPENAINRVVAATAPSGAWSRLERGELKLDSFYPAFEADCAAAGHEISARTMMERIGESSGPRAIMLDAIARIRARGLKVAALTNNWDTGDEGRANDPFDLAEHFDEFIESRVVGLRKPDPRIYELACSRLAVTPAGAVFLDDIGSNLKAARLLGMTTIKVVTPEAALAELEAVLGFELVG